MKLLFLFGFLLLCGLAFTEETQEEPQEDAEFAEINDEDQDLEDAEDTTGGKSRRIVCKYGRKRCINKRHCKLLFHQINSKYFFIVVVY